jgi:hypothetical protein
MTALFQAAAAACAGLILLCGTVALAQPGGFITPLVLSQELRVDNPFRSGVEVTGGATAQVARGNPPVVRVTGADGKVTASIGVSKDPQQFVYDPANNTLYVLHGERKVVTTSNVRLTEKPVNKGRVVSAVNLTTGKVEAEIAVGLGAAAALLVSPDGKRLYCYTATEGFLQVSKAPKPPYDPKIEVVDTATNKVTGAYRWMEMTAPPATKRRVEYSFSNRFVEATESGDLVVLSESSWRKGNKRQFVVFTATSASTGKAAFAVDTEGNLESWMLARNDKLLLALTRANAKENGSLAAIDLDAGTVKRRDLEDRGMRLARVGPGREPWLLSAEWMAALNEEGEPTGRRIHLNPPPSEATAPTGAAAHSIDGVPGEVLSLGNGRIAMLIERKQGGSDHRLAILDLNKLELEAILPTMSGAEKAQIRTRRITGTVLVAAASMGLIWVIPSMSFANESLAGQPDGHYLFALDLEGHEVTVVDVEAKSVVKRLAVNRTITRIALAANGKQLLCFGKAPERIDLAANNLAE